MNGNQIANLTLTIDPTALRSIIESGRLLEFVDTVARQAAAQISAQVVQHVAAAAVKPQSEVGGVSAQVAFVSVIGDGEPGFGTHPRPPRFGVSVASEAQPQVLRQVAAAGSETPG
jgi:hypothetical protein